MEAGSNNTKRPLHELKPQLRQGRRARSGGDHPTELTAAAPAPVVVTNPTDLTAAAPPLTNAAQTDHEVPGKTQMETDLAAAALTDETTAGRRHCEACRVRDECFQDLVSDLHFYASESKGGVLKIAYIFVLFVSFVHTCYLN